MTQQQALQLFLPILIIIPILLFRMRKIGKPQPLQWQYLWVRPAILLAVAALTLAGAPPLISDLPWLGLAAVLGAAAGWQWGRTMHIEMHPENGTLMARGGQAAMLVLVALIVFRLGFKTGLQMEASAWHIDIALITDVLIVFSAAMFALRALEMFLRARLVMREAGPVTVSAPAPKRRLWPLIVGGVVAFAVVGSGTFVFLEGGPRVRMMLCPVCAGFSRIAANVYVERSASPAQRQAALTAAADGQQRVRDFFGTEQGTPRFFVCVSEDCYAKLAPPRQRGVQFLDNIILSPRGTNGVIAAYEATYLELQHRAGMKAYSARNNIPQWFKEGLAAIVARDPRYLPPAVPQDCPNVSPFKLPLTSREWGEEMRRRPMVYAAAACVVRRELAEDGGKPALLTTLDEVRGGQGFPQLWHE